MTCLKNNPMGKVQHTHYHFEGQNQNLCLKVPWAVHISSKTRTESSWLNSKICKKRNARWLKEVSGMLDFLRGWEWRIHIWTQTQLCNRYIYIYTPHANACVNNYGVYVYSYKILHFYETEEWSHKIIF